MATDDNAGEARAATSRKEKRKLFKKEKRKQVRKEIAVREKEEEESRWNDSEVQCKLRQLEQEELERMERDRLEFEERERRFLEALELKKKREQEEFEQEEERERGRLKLADESGAKQVEEQNSKEMDGGSDWEYLEEGPAEIIWQGNEIIVKKKRVKVPKKNLEEQNRKEDVVRSISNPLAPQSESFETYKSAQDILDTVAQQVPNFGTEQDKAHCPFHLKTGACRFGTRCSRAHFYPDKSCTMLMKNMYGGPGLAWEQDEGLEHTDEEIDHSFEEFYEDVHTEFLKFGEIMNFKVCRNGSPHLRGNVYVHYKSLESAVHAYHSTNGRYFGGKQVICEFVNVTRWKVAICGEFMKSRLKRCSRGSACNFIHCFRNPGGDYEWADWDRPPPRYWIETMAALFGYEDGYNKQLGEVNHAKARSATESIRMDANRCHPRSRSREPDSRHTRSHNDDDNDNRRSKGQQWRHICKEREHSLDRDRKEEKMCGKGNHYIRGKSPNVYSDDDQSNRELQRINHERYYSHKKSHSRSRWHSKDRSSESDSDRGCAAKETRERYHEDYRSHRRSKRHSNGRSPGSDSDGVRSVKDGWERDHDRTHSRQKKRDSCHTEYECSSKDETLPKHLKCVHESVKRQDDDFDTCSSDSDGDSMVKNREGYHMKRRKASRWSSNEMSFSDDDVGDGYDRCENEYYRRTKERSNLETLSKKTDLSEYSRGFHRDKHGKRESSKHRKREKSRKSERIHKGRKESLWDHNKVEDHVVTAHEDHHEREVCEERYNPEKHGRLEDAQIDEGNGSGHTSPQKTRSGERTGDGHLSRQEYSVEVEIENEQACRRAALEKLQEKQLQKQLSSNYGNLKNPKTSSCNLAESVAIRMVDEDQNDSEAKPRKRRRI